VCSLCNTLNQPALLLGHLPEIYDHIYKWTWENLQVWIRLFNFLFKEFIRSWRKVMKFYEFQYKITQDILYMLVSEHPISSRIRLRQFISHVLPVYYSSRWYSEAGSCISVLSFCLGFNYSLLHRFSVIVSFCRSILPKAISTHKSRNNPCNGGRMLPQLYFIWTSYCKTTFVVLQMFDESCPWSDLNSVKLKCLMFQRKGSETVRVLRLPSTARRRRMHLFASRR
jgi:hypothetical protein